MINQEYDRRKTIKISTWLDLDYKKQLEIINNYFQKSDEYSDQLITTKKGTGTPIWVNHKKYHVSCHETKTQLVFNIWNG